MKDTTQFVEAERPSAEDREAFRESLRGYLAQAWPPEHAMGWGAEPSRVRGMVAGLAAQGLTALGADPSTGGLSEIVVAADELGRAASRAPVLAVMVLNLLAARDGAVPAPLAAQLASWQAGEAVPCLAFAAQDPDPCAGSVVLVDGAISGTLRCVEGASGASHLLVAVSDRRLALVNMKQPGIRCDESPLMDLGGSFELALESAAASGIDIGVEAMRDLLAASMLATAARAQGAAARAFDLVVAYVKERVQFGRPVGSFQAIQHKLANAHIALQAVRLSLEHAALEFDLAGADRHWYAAAAAGLAKSSLRQVSLETHHAFGAIGYSEEHEAPRHFRGVHVDVLRHGAPAACHEQLAARFLDHGNDFPAYDLGSAGNAFRLEVRAWLDRHWSGERKHGHDSLPFHEREYDPAFAAALGRTGWIGLSWPARFGGQGRSALEQLAFMEEMERAEAPRVGAPVQAVMLQMFGTPAQQARYLPEILRGEAMMGMGYSEPQAGSDLASLKTRAVRDGDDYVINGQKIWTTTHWGRYMLVAARTRAEAKPAHAGLSMFIVPMSAAGITVRPSTTMYGGTFANIFYDDVRVPAEAMVGAEGEGWKVLTGALAIERGLVGGGIVLKVVHLFEQLCAHLRASSTPERGPRHDPVVRSRLGELAAQVEAARQMMLQCARALDAGRLDLADAAASKVYSGELLERFGECALELLGLQGAVSQNGAGAILNGRFEQSLRHSLMWVISIGTNEIQRNLIAQRALGLPR